ncbi:MAG TPA: AmmeMemoRadiSam system protein B [Micropepsaceae bacterium]|nr:AmmeMemoRadiSam system protein B [Micropepsaceae bacterium]
MNSSLHPTHVAGTFYPANPNELAAGVDASLAKATSPPLTPKAVIAPHAGHVYSGDIAASAYRLLANRKGEIKRVILLGPNHRQPVRGMALSPADAWATPFGPLRVDVAARDTLARQTGVAVDLAPFVNEHSLEVHLPFIHRALGEVEILPILVGQTPRESVSQALDTLWGGPETAIVVSSDLSHYHDYATCQAKDEETTIAIERLQPAGCDGDRACGRFSIHGLLDQAQRRDLRVTALDVRNSGDTRGPRDRVVGYGSFAFEYAHSAQLDGATRQLLMRLAREVVRHGAHNLGQPLQLKFQGPVPRVLRAQRATFVTLKIGDRLRGCRGSLVPHRSLLNDVVENARKSAFDDPRFPPLTAAELEQLNFHISILSTPRRIRVETEAELAHALRPDIDGLIIRDAGKQAIFLPSVWEGIHDPLSFIRHLKHKAGLPPDHWSPSFEAFRYVTESFGDHPSPSQTQ